MLITFITVDFTSLDNVCCFAVDVHISLRLLAFTGLDEFGRDAKLLQVSLLFFRILLELFQEGCQCRLR